MLFAKDLPSFCLWCKNGSPLQNGQVLCRFRGPVADDGCCRRYSYDPYKRVPPKLAPLRKFLTPIDEKDFDEDKAPES